MMEEKNDFSFKFVAYIPKEYGEIISMARYRNKFVVCCVNGVFCYDIERDTIVPLMI